MRSASSAGVAAAVLFLAAGCATTHDRIVLLPDAQGHVGKIMVTSGKAQTQTLLDSAWSEADVAVDGTQKRTLDPNEVKNEFAGELAGLPARPISYFLYFAGDSEDLTPESQAEAPEILKEVANRPAAEVTVIGHTDTTAEADYNDKLSLERAGAVKSQLIRLGLDPAKIKVAGRGERDLAVPTPDGVNEPRNRRVEINVR